MPAGSERVSGGHQPGQHDGPEDAKDTVVRNDPPLAERATKVSATDDDDY